MISSAIMNNGEKNLKPYCTTLFINNNIIMLQSSKNKINLSVKVTYSVTFTYRMTVTYRVKIVYCKTVVYQEAGNLHPV